MVEPCVSVCICYVSLDLFIMRSCFPHLVDNSCIILKSSPSSQFRQLYFLPWHFQALVIVWLIVFTWILVLK